MIGNRKKIILSIACAIAMLINPAAIYALDADPQYLLIEQPLDGEAALFGDAPAWSALEVPDGGAPDGSIPPGESSDQPAYNTGAEPAYNTGDAPLHHTGPAPQYLPDGAPDTPAIQQFAAGPVIVPVDHSRDIGSIVDAARQYPHSGFNFGRETRFASQPIVSPVTFTERGAGSLHAEDMLDTLNAIKMVRYITGLPYDDIRFTAENNKRSQYGSYLLAVSGQFTHYPNAVYGMPADFYNIAYSGCNDANIAAGYPNVSASILAYMTEPGKNNIEHAGHRRWLLKPDLKNFGIGHVRGPQDDYGGYRSSIYVYDGTAPGEHEPDTYIAWPSSGDFPIQYMAGVSDIADYHNSHYLYPWSVNLGAAYQNPVRNNITLTLTRARGGAVVNTWVFDKDTPKLTNVDEDLSGMHFAVDNDGYGMRKAIVFKPDAASLGRIHDGDLFHVRIEGLVGIAGDGSNAPAELEYDIRFFDLQREMSRSNITLNVRHAGAPLAGAEVTVGGSVVTTGADGVARVRVANNGTYDFRVAKDGFTAETGTVTVGGVSVGRNVDMFIPVTLTFSDVRKPYSGAPQGLTVNAAPAVAFKAVYSGEAALDGATALPVGAGAYNVAAEVTAAGYRGSAGSAFTITRAPLTAAPDDILITYGDAPPAPSVSYTGLVGRDAAPGAQGVRAVYDLGEPNAPGGRYNAGTYRDAVVINAPDYDVDLLGSVLTIGRRPVTATGLAAFDRGYAADGVEALLNTFGVVIDGAFGSDEVYLDAANAVAVFADDVVGDGKAVSVSGLVLGGGQRANYTLSNASLTLTANIKDRLTAGDVAACFGSVHMAAKDSRAIALPAVPQGFEIVIAESGNPGIVSTDGAVTPVAGGAEVNVRLAVIRIEQSDLGGGHPDNYALTGVVKIIVPPFTQYVIEALAYVVDAPPVSGALTRVDGAGTYFIGDEVALEAVSLSNSVKFDGWYDNGVPIAGAGAEYRFAASSDRSLGARFLWSPPATPRPPSGGGGGTGGGGGGGGGGGSVAAPVPNPTPSLAPTESPTPSPTLSPAVRPTPSPGPARTPGANRRGRSDAAGGRNAAGRRNSADIPQMADIGDSHWAAKEIRHLVRMDIINGYPQDDGTYIYAPERRISRAEFMKLIAACLKLDLIEGYDGSGFSDWDKVEDWARPYVAALVEAGFVYGSLEGGGLYINPLSDVSREEMTAIAVRALGAGSGPPPPDGIPPPNGMSPPDGTQYAADLADIQDWALESAVFALANGLVNTRAADGEPQPPPKAGATAPGAAAGERWFKPGEPSRRDESAVILYNLLRFNPD